MLELYDWQSYYVPYTVLILVGVGYCDGLKKNKALGPWVSERKDSKVYSTINCLN